MRTASTRSIVRHFVAFFACVFFVLQASAAVTPGPQPPFVQPTQMVLNPASAKLYVVGSGGPTGSLISVVDTKTSQVTAYIQMPVGTQVTSPLAQLFVNQVANRIFVLSGHSITAIDGATDTVLKTATFPLTVGAIGAYAANTNKLYLIGSSGISVVDANTLAQSRTIQGLGPTLASGPNHILVNPANNKIYAVYDFATATAVQVIDGNTDRVIVQTKCAPCSPILEGLGTVMTLNAADNSVWFFSTTTSTLVTTGHEPGGGPLPNPPATTAVRMDGTTNLFTQTNRFYGLFDGSFGIAGTVFGVGSYLPRVADPIPSLTVGGAADTGASPELAVFDPLNTARLTDVSVNGTLLKVPVNSNFSCGQGTIGAFGIVGVDASTGNIYWRCDPTVSTGASIVISKTSFVPTDPGILPPDVLTQGVIQLSADLNFPVNTIGASPAIYDSLHRAFFLSTAGNSLLTVDPVAVTLSTLGLGNAAAPPAPPTPPNPPPTPPTPPTPPAPPATFIVSGQVATSKGGLAGVTVAIGGVRTTVTDAAGNFAFAKVTPGTYVVAVATPGVLAESKTVSVVSANVNVSFSVLTSPLQISGVTWSANPVLGPGASLTATVQFSQPAPSALTLTLATNNAKALKVPATLKVAAGASSVTFSAQASGVPSAATALVSATYIGTFAPAGSTGNAASVTVFPADNVRITKTTWSKSTFAFSLQATDTNPAATINVLVGNAVIGTMINQGNGTYTFNQQLSANPVSVKIVSNIGGNTSQGVSLQP